MHSVLEQGRGSPLFFKVIHQIARSHGPKMNNLNPIWERLLGQSQLSNPSDLPCFLPRIFVDESFEILHRVRQSYCCALYDISEGFANKNCCYNQTRFCKIHFEWDLGWVVLTIVWRSFVACPCHPSSLSQRIACCSNAHNKSCLNWLALGRFD